MSSGRSSSILMQFAELMTVCSANVPSRHIRPRSCPRAWWRAVWSEIWVPVPRYMPNSHRLLIPCAHGRQRPHTGRKLKITRSPGERSGTPGPTSSTMPAPSWPPMMGSGQGRSPVRTCSSEWHRPLPRIETRTSPALGASSSISSTDHSLPRSHSTAARVFIDVSSGSAVDGLEVLVVREALGTELTADAARLDPAEGRDRVGQVAVDPDRAGADPVGDGESALGVGGPDRAAEPEVRVVRDADRVGLVLVGDHRQEGAEDLLLRDRGVVVDVGEHRRLDEPTGVAARGAAAADGDPAALGAALRDVALHPVALPGAGHRA